MPDLISTQFEIWTSICTTDLFRDLCLWKILQEVFVWRHLGDIFQEVHIYLSSYLEHFPYYPSSFPVYFFHLTLPTARGFTTHWISSKLSDHAIIPYRIMDCIDVENRIDLVQWPVLPVFNLWQDLIRHIRNLNAKQKNSPAPATSGTGDLSYFILFSSLKIQSMSYRSVYRKS